MILSHKNSSALGHICFECHKQCFVSIFAEENPVLQSCPIFYFEGVHEEPGGKASGSK